MRQMSHPLATDISLPALMYALSDPVRLEIVCRLYDGCALTCGQLTGDHPKSSMSFHFKVLREAGLIRTQAEGKEHFNTLRKDELDNRFPGILQSVILAANIQRDL